jgi:hypothetical protein
LHGRAGAELGGCKIVQILAIGTRGGRNLGMWAMADCGGGAAEEIGGSGAADFRFSSRLSPRGRRDTARRRGFERTERGKRNKGSRGKVFEEAMVSC